MIRRAFDGANPRIAPLGDREGAISSKARLRQPQYTEPRSGRTLKEYFDVTSPLNPTGGVVELRLLGGWKKSRLPKCLGFPPLRSNGIGRRPGPGCPANSAPLIALRAFDTRR